MKQTTLNLSDNLLRNRTFFTNEETCFCVDWDIKSGATKNMIVIHGFNDFNFNQELNRKLIKDYYNVFSVSLHRYGPNIKSYLNPEKDTLPFYFENINEYFLDLDTIFSFIMSKSNLPIEVMGHSTGGLIATHYAAKGKFKDKISYLILNSPFFDFDESPILEGLIDLKAISILPKTFKLSSEKIQDKNKENTHYVNPSYFEYTIKEKIENPSWWDRLWNITERDVKTSLSKDGFDDIIPTTDVGIKGETTPYIYEKWPEYVGWILGINEAQKEIQCGKIKLSQPVILLTTDTDSILSNKEILKYGEGISTNTSIINIRNGYHNVFCSKKDIRDKFYNEMIKILRTNNVSTRSSVPLCSFCF